MKCVPAFGIYCNKNSNEKGTNAVMYVAMSYHSKTEKCVYIYNIYIFIYLRGVKNPLFMGFSAIKGGQKQ